MTVIKSFFLRNKMTCANIQEGDETGNDMDKLQAHLVDVLISLLIRDL